MQTHLRNLISNRGIMLVLMIAFITILSWRLAPQSSSAFSLSDLNTFTSDTASRTNASTDAQIQSLQDQLRSHGSAASTGGG